jgi:cobalt-zinc-cadmium efflux system outer membrane protein
METIASGGRAVPRVVALLLACGAGAALAQQPVTREEAVAAALARGPRALRAAPDVAAARAEVAGARAFQNPTATASHTGSVPTYHAELEIPLDFPWLRAARIGAAESALSSARFRYAYERAGARFDAEVAYVHALTAGARARVTRRNAADADSLLTLARLRRETGDASALDVELATVAAGQAAAAADADSLAAVGAVLDLQAVMGLPADRVTVSLTDSLTAPALESDSVAGVALLVAAADAALQAQDRALALARRSVFAAPSLTLGMEGGDPSGTEKGPLAVVGLALPLPLFNRNGAAIQSAAAARDRSRVEADVARRESDANVAAARRELAAALRRVARDRVLLASAERVAAMSLLAYGEGAVALPSVLEAQRTAREALADSVADLAAANVAAAALRLVTATAMTEAP